ncbi:MAG: allantoinase AllB [Acidobacteria bacterium]|nr:allantoinase AllB [Acidobacteriota bacterium]MBV9477172.1 allantoinase AllB [Acidobacteriota bacterium]
MRIRSTRVVLPTGVAPATITIDGERIAAIEPHATRADVDYGDLVILPALVDSHVHVNEPGRTEWEGFATATRAAAAGGIATIVDMPLNSIPPTTTVDALNIKRQHAHGDVDVELWGGVIPGNTSELRPMLDAGARGFKCFLVPSGVDEFPHVDERALREAARELAGTGAPLLVHAELEEHLRAVDSDPNEYSTYLRSRPALAEDAAIELLVRVCRDTGARIHVVHLSSASALAILANARAEGLPISAETTPHYLHFDAESVPRAHTEYKCAPPIRERANREELWRGLRDGILDLVVSDHSPCTPELKRGDFLCAWGGIASLQFVLPIVWTHASARGFTLHDVARWCCAAPAQLARLDGKGAIAIGNYASLTVFAHDEPFVVDTSIIEHRHKLTPYLGTELRGVVKATYVHGVDKLRP